MLCPRRSFIVCRFSEKYRCQSAEEGSRRRGLQIERKGFIFALKEIPGAGSSASEMLAGPRRFDIVPDGWRNSKRSCEMVRYSRIAGEDILRDAEDCPGIPSKRR